MDEYALNARVDEAKQAFGRECAKYTGAVTVEAFRRAFLAHGIAISPPDVFLAGLDIEIDLVVPREGATPHYGVLYQPDEVVAALEIKRMGAFGSDTGVRLRRTFDRIQQVNPQIACMYVTLAERQNYKHRLTDENLGYPAYTLFYHTGSSQHPTVTATGDWGRLLEALHALQ